MKQWIKNKIKNMLGATEIIAQTHYLKNLAALESVKYLDIDSKLKEQIALFYFPTLKGGVRVLNNNDGGGGSALLRRYLDLICPYKSSEIKLRRIGGKHDGGYCHIIPEIKNAPLAVSLGVSPHSPWDLEMAELGFKVAQYDASITKAPYNHKNITFHKKFVGTKDEGDTISFERVMAENNANKSAHNILQCDIEDAEWEILDNIDLNLVAECFSQVIFEFHNCDPQDSIKSEYRLRILEKLRAHFTPIHTHFNDYGDAFYDNGLFFCDVLEVSYLRNDLLPKDAKRLSGIATIPGLDSSNARHYPDVPVIFP